MGQKVLNFPSVDGELPLVMNATTCGECDHTVSRDHAIDAGYEHFCSDDCQRKYEKRVA